jgi:S-formylglutathione hydrolase FrmB
MESEALRSNPLGDPFVRDLPVYLPPSYYNCSTEYPVVVCLAGFTGSALSWFNFQAWVPTIDERMDSLIASGVPEMILVFPDCFTRFGGSQYLNSPAVGNYETYIIEEVVPLVDATFRTRKDRHFRGVMGKSSGGFGALTLSMRHPDIFSAVACHSGDLYFEYCYIRDFAVAARMVRKYGGIRSVIENFAQIPKSGKDDHAMINTLAMSACYSPNTERKPHMFDLPFDERTGKLRRSVWNRWKTHDPVEVVKTRGRNLNDYGLVYLDCGTRDEFGLYVGARIFISELKKLGVPAIYEEFEGGHFQTQERYNTSLLKMAQYFTAENTEQKT